MTMKKNVLALAVSGGLIAAPMAAMAEPEVYGLIDIGVESFNDSDGVAANEIFGGFNSVDGTNSTDGFGAGRSDAKDFELSNGLQSRIGVRGSEELPVAGLTASYNMEFTVDVLDEDGGGIGNAVGTRLGWAALGGDWGKVKVGSQWQALFEYGGWNTHRTDVHGYGAYYYTSSVLNNSLAYGFRQSSAISYEYGSAWGHSDPFSAQVTLGVGEGAEGTPGVVNQEGISSVQAAGQYSIDQRISVNAVFVQEFNDYQGVAANNALNQEPTLMNVGGRWNVTDALELAVNYTTVDIDDAGDNSRDSMAVASFMDFGNGLSGHLGFANGSDDRDTSYDIDLNTYGYIKQALSDRTDVRLELENIQYDNAQDSSSTVALVALQHNF
ncbi:porin-like protein [Halospina denitrificans]|uniref:Porin-like protein n=1 Tax=Halospina denitrificans TaxID=332522 RepID=A0A4R7K2N5_9GAMM|nr:porin [Halospina denitrificans]TDT44193.1 porin-like protein [Halospina denitrificans]